MNSHWTLLCGNSVSWLEISWDNKELLYKRDCQEGKKESSAGTRGGAGNFKCGRLWKWLRPSRETGQGATIKQEGSLVPKSFSGHSMRGG
jgi:hypothetical protein